MMFKAEVKSKIGEDISILVQLENHSWNYLCECGNAAALTVKELQNARAVFISHTHIDHFVNFDAVIRHQIGTERRVVICGPKGIAKQVKAKIDAYTWNLIKKGAITYEIREVDEPESIRVYEIEPPRWDLREIGTREGNVIFEDNDFEVTNVLLDHKTPTMAYKFKQADSTTIDLKNSEFKGGKWVNELKQAYQQGLGDQLISVADKDFEAAALFHLLTIQKGHSLGIIMDHAATPENHALIMEHFHACDLVLIESFYKAADKAFAEANFHSYSTQSGRVMRAAKVKKAVPVHFSRKYIEPDLEELLAEFDAGFGGDDLS
jgi:ribonuclease Z